MGDRTYFFIADTHEDKTDWINIIGKAIIMKSQARGRARPPRPPAIARDC